MATETTIEVSLEAVERAAVEFKVKLEVHSSPNWLDQVIGSFKDEPEFDDVIR